MEEPVVLYAASQLICLFLPVMEDTCGRWYTGKRPSIWHFRGTAQLELL